MAVKKPSIKKPQVSVPDKVTIPIPKKLNVVYLLVGLLVVASFLLGMLFTEVRYLKNGGGNTVLSATDEELAAEDTGPVGPVDVEPGDLPILGNADAKVEIIEFSDFECPFCKAMYDEALVQIKKDYVDTGKVKFSYRHYPLESIHPNAKKAAEASECANEQGKFWEYHDQLFENQDDWVSLTSDALNEKFVEFATTIGIDGATLGECVTSGRMAKQVEDDLADGTEAGVDGTPATFINGMMISGAAPYADFKAEIEKQLAAN